MEGLGSWQITNGQEMSTATVGGFVMFGDYSWTDYDFSCQATHPAAKGTISLFVRESNRYSGYAVQFGVGETESFISDLGNNRLKQIGKPEEGLKPETQYKLTVKVRGDKIDCLVDGKSVFSATDGEHRSGRVGVKGTGIKFRDFEVLDPDGKVLFQGIPLRKN